MTAPAPSVVVIGGGISGLAIGYELLERSQRRPGGIRLHCFESAERPGGNVRSDREDGFLVEWGPNGFLDNSPPTLTLVRRLGLDEDCITAREEAARRFIFRSGRLREVPTTPGRFLRSDILGPLAKARLLAEPCIPRRRDDGDETVFDFAARRIGPAAAATLIDAMVSGIHAGDARQLSLRATFPKMVAMEEEHGGLFRAMLAKMLAKRKEARSETAGAAGGPAGPAGRLRSFRGGLQQLTDRLASKLGDRLQLASPVDAVSPMGDRGFRVHRRTGPPLDVDAVVLAAPAPLSARLLSTSDHELAACLAAIPFAPLCVVHLGYTGDAVGGKARGFGFLVPRGHGPRILGSLFPSETFAGRAPDKRTLITTMIGGAHDPAAMEFDDRELVAAVRRDLHTVLGVEVAPYFKRIHRHPRGIPQYTVGHLERLEEIDRRLAKHPGLFVAGNSYRGIALNSCLAEAATVAEDVLSHVGFREQQPGASLEF